jgi:hypothetical protein
MAPADSPSKTTDQLMALMKRAQSEGRLKTARKTRPVDARPARAGEVVVTTIKGEGKETQSPPAAAGDWVVRNRCPETGNEEYLVRAKAFRAKYRPTGNAGAESWKEFQPLGKDARFYVIRPEDGSFSFTAPWGEPTMAHPGDVLLQDPDNDKAVYRVAWASFACTYEEVG